MIVRAGRRRMKRPHDIRRAWPQAVVERKSRTHCGGSLSRVGIREWMNESCVKTELIALVLVVDVRDASRAKKQGGTINVFRIFYKEYTERGVIPWKNSECRGVLVHGCVMWPTRKQITGRSEINIATMLRFVNLYKKKLCSYFHYL